jgi:phosphoribosylformylglycinamidine cyclo-ligase
MKKRKLTYKDSGVDIQEGNRLVDIIKPLARATFKPYVLNDIGSFGAFCRLDTRRYRNPILVSSTDGVGTKLKIAFMTNRHDTVGIDLVAMCVNDILTSGAAPMFFLDYFASGKLSTSQAGDVIRGIARGCEMADCSLIGGETAEMPGFYARGEYDLSGFAVGVVDRKNIIDGRGIKEGDVMIGLGSSGLHSNGYSLVRRLFFDLNDYSHKKKIRELGCTLGEALLAPTRIYVKSVLSLIKTVPVKGVAHITGGGLTENLPRIFPEKAKLKFVIERDSWPVHPIFTLIQSLGNIDDGEMFRTFNMGIGMVLVTSPDHAGRALRKLKRLGEDAYTIGRVAKGLKTVEYI